MKRKIKSFWKWLRLPFKFVFVIWFVISLNALTELSIFQWFLIWTFGCLIFVLAPQFVLNLKDDYINKKNDEDTFKKLNEYKINYTNLDEIEKGSYNSMLQSLLNRAKLDANTINTTSNLKLFIEKWNDLVYCLNVLSQHEFTGYFKNKLPSDNLYEITRNKTYTEIKFIKRALIRKSDGKYVITSDFIKYSSFFSDPALKFVYTGKEPILNNNDSQQCNELNSFDYMDGRNFEYFCADLLKKNSFYNVEVTQGSGDHGIDILAEKDDITYAIQCKCYSKDIGNSAVQQAHTGKSLYKKDIAVVLTNRNFTTQAQEEAKALGVKLWNRDKLLSFIDNSNEV